MRKIAKEYFKVLIDNKEIEEVISISGLSIISKISTKEQFNIRRDSEYMAEIVIDRNFIDDLFMKWIIEQRKSKTGNPKNIDIIFLDGEKNEILKIELINCYPSEWYGPEAYKGAVYNTGPTICNEKIVLAVDKINYVPI